jgi:hypothetical protein
VSDRDLTPEERARLRAGVFEAIDRHEGWRRRRRRLIGVTALGCVLASLVAGAAMQQPTSSRAGVVDAIPVRCGTADVAAADSTIPSQVGHDPRLLCAELWRRGELIGGPRKAAELGACPQLGERGVLVLVYAGDDAACRRSGA